MNEEPSHGQPTIWWNFSSENSDLIVKKNKLSPLQTVTSDFRNTEKRNTNSFGFRRGQIYRCFKE